MKNRAQLAPSRCGISTYPILDSLRLQNDFHRAWLTSIQSLEPSRPFIERRDGGDQRRNIDGSLLHQGNTFRILAIEAQLPANVNSRFTTA